MNILVVILILVILFLIFNFFAIGADRGYEKMRNKEISMFFPPPPPKRKKKVKNDKN